MPILLLGLAFEVFAIASLLDANRITTNLRRPGVFDLMGPDRYLMAIGVILLLLGLGLIFQGVRQLRTATPTATLPVATEPVRTHLWLLGAIILYVVLMPVAGYAIATLAFFLAAFRIMGMHRWGWTIGSAVLVTASFVLIFVWAADMPLPKGWLQLG
jgi:hypothetical protein